MYERGVRMYEGRVNKKVECKLCMMKFSRKMCKKDYGSFLFRIGGLSSILDCYKNIGGMKIKTFTDTSVLISFQSFSISITLIEHNTSYCFKGHHLLTFMLFSLKLSIDSASSICFDAVASNACRRRKKFKFQICLYMSYWIHSRGNLLSLSSANHIQLI